MTTKIVNDRETGLKIGFTATDWSQKVAFEDYVKALENWKIDIIVKNDEPIGAIYRQKNELHVSILPKWRRKWFTKSLYKELFVGKKVITKVTPGHDYMYDILQRIGFRYEVDGTMVKD